jgi:HK97 family phage major capsid protein
MSVEKILELQKAIQSRMAEVEAMKNKAEGEKRNPTDEERQKAIEWIKDAEEMAATVEVFKREATLKDKLSQGANDVIIRPNLMTEDELQKKFQHMPPKELRFSSFGENILAIKTANQGGGQDRRLGFVEGKLRATGMGEAVPSDGGFLLQPDYSSELITAAYAASPVVSRVRRIPIGPNANGLVMNAVKESSRVSSIWGGIIMYWLDEAADKTPSAPKLRKIELKLKKVAGLWYATDELLQDATALSAVANAGFTEALDMSMEGVILRGSGVGQPLGILLSGCLISVGKETGQLADTIQAENIVNMFARMWPRGMSNAIWLISQSILPQLMFMTMPGLPTIPLYMPPGGLSVAPYGTLMGRPVFAIENCSKLGDKGDIIFADLSQYLLIDKGGPQTASSIHVKFVSDETAFRIVYRTDGQPVWVEALTPKDNSSTVSPFITLDERA